LIPFVDLKAQYRSIKPEIDSAIANVVESGAFILGKEVAAFEQEFAAYCECDSAIGVNSGTSALHLALLATGVGPGDEVITVPFTFVATVAAIGYTGARPVLVDIDPRSYTMDPAAFERAITDRTKAVMPVHLFGQSADMDPIMEIARRHKLIVIEDACQAHGALYKGRRVGSIGDLGCFSFYPAKNLGAYGEGGAIVTNRADHAGMLRLLRNWGEETRYHHLLKAYNYRMEGITGAVLRVKLRKLDQWNESRRCNANTYASRFAGSCIVPPYIAAYGTPVFSVYAVRTSNRSEVHQRLTDKGIQTAIHYPFPIHLLDAWQDLDYKAGDFPVSERVAEEVLSLPIYPELTPQQIDSIASAMLEAAANA
jgi:dTDP-4-amino-4,6-dideoxygalactose transaminase